MVDFIPVSDAENMSPFARFSSTNPADARLIMTEIWPFTATQIGWWPKTTKAAKLAIAKSLGAKSLPELGDDLAVPSADGGHLLPLMPAKILAVGPTSLSQAQCDLLAEKGFTRLDLSAGRACLKLEGQPWTWTLAKGCSLDLESMVPGQVAHTTLFKVACAVWMQNTDTVVVMAPISFAAALAEKVIDAAEDIGINFRNRLDAS